METFAGIFDDSNVISAAEENITKSCQQSKNHFFSSQLSKVKIKQSSNNHVETLPWSFVGKKQTGTLKTIIKRGKLERKGIS